MNFRSFLSLPCLFFVGTLLTSRPLLAQDPKLAAADLRHSEQQGKFHLVARVSLEVERGKYQRYQFDRYKEVRRIKESDGATYAQPQGKLWLKSEDWGETGQPVPADKARELDGDARLAVGPFEKPVTHDPTQGGFVWKLVELNAKGLDQFFTYERTREHPHPDGVYPRYTFIKYKGDKDGELSLDFYTGQLRGGAHDVPISIQFDYLLPLPPGTKIEFATPPPKGGHQR